MTDPQCPDCGKRHRTFSARAKCIWPTAIYVRGEGRHALVTVCPVPAVSLFPDYQSAREDLDLLARHRCGPWCRRHHELVTIGTEAA